MSVIFDPRPVEILFDTATQLPESNKTIADVSKNNDEKHKHKHRHHKHHHRHHDDKHEKEEAVSGLVPLKQPTTLLQPITTSSTVVTPATHLAEVVPVASAATSAATATITQPETGGVTSSAAPAQTIAKFPPVSEYVVESDPLLFKNESDALAAVKSVLDGLIVLKRTLQTDGSDCFDADDVRVVDERLFAVTKDYEERETKLRSKRQLYDEKFIRIQQLLTKREEILNAVDAATSILSNDDHVAEMFAIKQRDLQDIVEQTRILKFGYDSDYKEASSTTTRREQNTKPKYESSDSDSSSSDSDSD